MTTTRVLAVASMCVLSAVRCVSQAAPQPSAREPGDLRSPVRRLPSLARASVSVPWPELRGLLEAARAADRPRPPVSHVFSPASYTATVAAGSARVVGRCEVNVLDDAWALVPLGPAGGEVRRVTVDGKPCPVVLRDKVLHALLSGQGAKKLEVELEAPVARARGGGSFQVPLLGSPIVTVTTILPRGGLEVRADGASGVRVSEAAGRSTAVTCHRGGSVASISWSPRAVPPKALPAKIHANTATLVTVEAGRIRCRAQVNYNVLHAGVDTFRIALPDGVELLDVSAPTLRHWRVVKEAKGRSLLCDLKDVVRGDYELTVMYQKRLVEKAPAAVVGLLSHPSATEDRGSVGIEVRGGLEVRPTVKDAERVDVRELSGSVWSAARAPVLMGFRYAKAGAAIELGITRHRRASVLVAMSDVCEAATTVTPDGRAITKMMFILRNNLKPHMRLALPAGAEVWSAFVKDRPVTPVRAADGDLLVPLVKSDSEEPGEFDESDSPSYRARRDRRRRQRPGEANRVKTPRRPRQIEKLRRLGDEPPAELKCYDVEIVFVTPTVKLAEKGELKVALAKCDIPTGHLAWAVFLPRRLRVVDAAGSLKEVASFTLPFRHFADAKNARRLVRAEFARAQQLQEAVQELAKAQDRIESLAEAAKARGVLPVRVEMPVTGQVCRFEKLLVVDEAPQMTLTYRRKID